MMNGMTVSGDVSRDERLFKIIETWDVKGGEYYRSCACGCCECEALGVKGMFCPGLCPGL